MRHNTVVKKSRAISRYLRLVFKDGLHIWNAYLVLLSDFIRYLSDLLFYIPFLQIMYCEVIGRMNERNMLIISKLCMLLLVQRY